MKKYIRIKKKLENKLEKKSNFIIHLEYENPLNNHRKAVHILCGLKTPDVITIKGDGE